MVVKVFACILCSYAICRLSVRPYLERRQETTQTLSARIDVFPICVRVSLCVCVFMCLLIRSVCHSVARDSSV